MAWEQSLEAIAFRRWSSHLPHSSTQALTAEERHVIIPIGRSAMMEKSAAQAEFEQNAPMERKIVYQGRTISLRCDTLAAPGHPHQKWDIVVHPGAVVIVPITQEGKVILVKQWRRAVGKILFELPAGTLEQGEPPTACAHREIREETGFMSRRMVPLGGFYSAPGFSTEYLHLFAAFDLESSPATPDDDEAIDLYTVSLKEAWDMIQTHEICDAKTIAGLARYEQFISKEA